MSVTAEYTVPGLHVLDHEVEVPLDWTGEDPGTITVFAREVVSPSRRHEPLPLLLFLQGGPGGESPRPVDASGWLAPLLERFRVVLLDQRGTGRSTPMDAARISRFADGDEAGRHLSHFRADSIVRDAEHLRLHEFGGRRWSTLGQSYGGWITMTYLSIAPEALTACLLTGGLGSLRPSAAEVYRRTFPKALQKNDAYDRRYPDDAARVARIADLLTEQDVRLPDGDRLTVRRLQFLGNLLGTQHGADHLHHLLDEALEGDRFTDGFLAEVQAQTSFAGNPLWAVLQESLYGVPGTGATAWAAQAERDRRPEFAEDARPLRFTGEAMFPWMFEEVRLLRPFAAAAEALARKEHWSALYDLDRLAANRVPVMAAVYHDDLYVAVDLSLETAAHVGGVRTWITDEWEHDALRVSGEEVVRHLLRMLDDAGGPLR